jgi:YesN/AraC family two-component response regulator
MRKILVIDDEHPVRDIMKTALTGKGFEVFEASNGKNGISEFEERDPEIIITDVNMPEMTGIELTKQIKDLNPEADVIIMTGYGTEELVIEALRSGASNYIKKPIQFNELFNILDNIILKKENMKRFVVSKDVVLHEKKHLVLGNDMLKVWGTVNQIVFNLPPTLHDKTVEGIKLGLYEMLVNAIEHGNLGITYDEKKEALEAGNYSTLFEKRLKEAIAKGKVVGIESTYSGDELVVIIRDQGPGFDYRNLPSLTEPDALLSAHGRGILLASLYFDTISYEDPGNAVTLVKKLIKEL